MFMNLKVIYVGVFFVVCGIYLVFLGIIIWLLNNFFGSYKWSVGMVIYIGVGNFGGVSLCFLVKECRFSGWFE